MSDSFDEWLSEVADALNIEPEDVFEYFPQAKELLYDTGASAREAADFIRISA